MKKNVFFPSTVNTSAWVDLATFQSERHRAFFKGVRSRMDVLPAPEGCLGLWSHQRARDRQGRGSDRGKQVSGARSIPRSD